MAGAVVKREMRGDPGNNRGAARCMHATCCLHTTRSVEPALARTREPTPADIRLRPSIAIPAGIQIA